MPARLQPNAPLAADAILVGDPGRALLLAQELLEQPKMSNHARGLWGYTGRTHAGTDLTIQSTGMGAPSAAVVLADLAELGVRRAVRVGTCVGLELDLGPGELLIVTEAVATAGSATAFGVAAGTAVRPDPDLLARLRAELAGKGRDARVVSLDTAHGDTPALPGDAAGADMQTVAVLARAAALGIAIGAVLVVTETASGDRLDDAGLEAAAKLAGGAASGVLSP